MISPSEMRQLRDQLDQLSQLALMLESRVPKIRRGYVKQIRAGLDAVVTQTRDLERKAWDDP